MSDVMPNCGICSLLAASDAAEGIFENDLWHVRPLSSPCPLPGWMMLISRRHVPGPAYLNDAEAANFGLALRHFERVLQDVSGAARIYTAALGESSPHLHVHMVPRYESMPKDAKGWAVFDLERALGAGEFQENQAEVARVHAAYRAALVAKPPPR